MGRLQLIAFALGAIVFASAAGAQGQDERKQGPVEIDRCQTISEPGSYKLVNNLIAQQGADCLPVTATGNVTIDLSGFSITANPIPGGTAIKGFAAQQAQGFLVVRNGAISGFETAVQYPNVAEGLDISGCGPPCSVGIETSSNVNSIVKNNIVQSLTAYGISATGLVTGNVATENQVGIAVGAGSTVIGNTAAYNVVNGIDVTCPSNVINNTATNNPPQLGIANLQLSGTGCNNTNNVAP